MWKYPTCRYVCEISPPSARGRLTTGPQFMVCFGLVVGYFICYGTASIAGSMSWRLPFIILTALSLAFAASVLLYLPPSPRWLRLHGKDAEADAVWRLLGVKVEDREIIEEDLQEGVVVTSDAGLISSQLPAQVLENRNQKEGGFFDMFKKDIRGRTMLAFFLMGFLQLSGIDAILYVRTPPSNYTLRPLTHLSVRPPPLPTSRPHQQRSLFPRIRCLRHCPRCCFRPRPPPRRQMGPAHKHHDRRSRSHHYHHSHGRPVR